MIYFHFIKISAILPVGGLKNDTLVLDPTS